jgi:site-specific DNA recombinase
MKTLGKQASSSVNLLNVPLAAYARFSSDLQRPASINDQLRNCREGAADVNGFVLDESIYTDSGKTGTILNGRDGLSKLIEVAVSGRAPFKGIVIDDTSRLGRNVDDGLAILAKLRHANIFLYFVTQRLDMRGPTSRQMYIMLASNDEQHSIQLGHKVRRGQIGRVLDGYIATGVPYGYTALIDEDTNQKRRGRAGSRGSKLVINPEQAAIIIRIFELGAKGYGSNTVARLLNTEGVLSSKSLKSGERYSWTARAIKLIWENEKYKGRNVWNKTKTVRNPATGKMQQVARPEDDWVIGDIPSARIVSDELWEAANEAKKQRREKHPGPVRGGMFRTEKSKTYIFSGLLTCGECGGTVTIIQNRKNCPRYVCARALRYQTKCNRRSIHLLSLEPRLLQVIAMMINSTLADKIVEAILRKQVTTNCDGTRWLRCPILWRRQTA